MRCFKCSFYTRPDGKEAIPKWTEGLQPNDTPRERQAGWWCNNPKNKLKYRHKIQGINDCIWGKK